MQKHGFYLKSSTPCPEVQGTAHIYVHEQSGAQLLYIENNDPEKVFSIAFKTIPEDSTGVFHILEHSVLCGSQKYPLREPFVDLLKGSMQTFLNAMTFPDKTMYPIATLNEKDYMNLMGVYLDAVFCPRIYEKKEIFMQEGWHLELPEGGDPYFNGVVYNEMKGAYSRPERVLDAMLDSALFPDTCYAHSSGGNPPNIPDLTYEQFLSQHKKYYHPENSYIFLYGAMDLEEKLAYIHQEYLSKYTRQNNQFAIKMQKPIGFKRVDGTYMIDSRESEENNALLASSYVYGSCTDRKTGLLMGIIMEAIAGSNESPLKKAMLATGIGEEFSADFGGAYQTQVFFSMRKADQNRAEEFRATLHAEIERICTEGINRDALYACLNAREFAARENDTYGPAGISYAVQVMEGWLHGADPVSYLSMLDVIADVRADLATDLPESMLREAVLRSNHSALGVLSPSKTLAAEQAEQEKARAAAYAASLSPEAIAKCKEEVEALRVFQTAEDTPELKAMLPRLSLSDLSPQATPDIPTIPAKHQHVDVLLHPIDTNGILYANYYFSIDDMPYEALSRLSLLCRMLTELPTANHSTFDLDTAIKAKLGQLAFGVDVQRDKETGKLLRFVTVAVSALDANIDAMHELVEEVALTTHFDQREVKQLLQQEVIYTEQYLIGAGHAFALTRARAKHSDQDKCSDAITGYGYLEYIRKALQTFDETPSFCQDLADLAITVFEGKKVILSLTGSEASAAKFMANPVKIGKKCLQNNEKPPVFPDFSDSQGIRIPAAVAYDAMSISYADLGVNYSEKMRVMSQIVSLDYLWNMVRVQGGAYGTGMSVSDAGQFGFYSYRDPNVRKTLDTFKATAEYLKAFDTDEQTMAGYIISIVSGMDKPIKPKNAGKVADTRYLTHVTYALREERRNQALSTTIEDLHQMGDVISRAAESASICVVGAADKVEEAKDLFSVITA